MVPPSWRMPEVFCAGDPEVVVLEEPLPPVADAGELEAVLLPAADDGADDRVQAGAISSPGEDGDLHVDDLRLECSPTSSAARRRRARQPPRVGVFIRTSPRKSCFSV